MSRLAKFPLIDFWKPFAIFVCGAVIVAGLLFFKLDALPGGYSPAERQAAQASSNLQDIANAPMYAPYNLLVYGFSSAGVPPLLATRLASTMLAFLAVGAFYMVARHWFGTRAAIYSSLLFACSAWFLHSARMGTPEAAQLLFIGLLAYGLWFSKAKHTGLVLLVGSILVALFLYLPGFALLFTALFLLGFKHVTFALQRTRWPWWIISSVCFVLLVTPLAYGLAAHTELIKPWIGLPSKVYPLEILKSMAEVPYNLFISGPNDPATWLGRLPVLDVLVTALVGLGIYQYIRNWGLDRSKIYVLLLALGFVLVGLSDNLSISLILPLVYLAAAAGLALLLRRWLRVFPRNPFARFVGLGLVAIAVGMACYYNSASYFLAWAHAPATEQVYTIKQ